MQWTEHKHAVILGLAIAAFVVFVSAIGFQKYEYRYQGLDLAIYTNVLWNLSHGYGWYSSVQGSSYLGDHVEPILLLLVPLFRLWSDPRLLIIAQAVAIGLSAVPLFLLAGRVHGRSKETSLSLNHELRIMNHGIESGSRSVSMIHNSYPIILSMLWLLNPLLWNSALFEFHALAFAPVLVLTAAHFFIQRKFWWFLTFATASVFVREDIALVIAMFAIIAAIDRRRWNWILPPLFVGIGWFIVSTQIGAAHNPAGSYKFLTYYSWIARSEFIGYSISGFAALAWGVVSQPLKALAHLFTIGNIDMFFGLLMPFVFLPLLRPKWLLLAIPPALQILLSGTGGNELVVTLHYSILFLPALVLATRDGLIAWLMVEEHPNAANAIRMPRMREWLERRLPNFPRRLAVGMSVGWVLAVAVAIGPFQGIANLLIRGASADDRARRAAYDELLARIPVDASVAASYAALPRVAARRSALNLEYAYLGVTQFAEATYELPEDTAYLLMDARDARAYAVQFQDVAWARPHAAGGAERLRKMIAERGFRVIAERNDIALLARLGFAEQNLGGLARDPSGSALDDRYLEAKEAPRGALRVDALRDIRLIE